MERKLIFVEGVSGVGKSTATSLLRSRLEDMDSAFDVYLEGDCHNPLDPFEGAYPPAMPLAAFAATYIDCWRRYMENRPEQSLILDGTLLHHQINDLLRNYSASDETIVAHLSALLNIIRPVHPVVFYLSARDVGQRLMLARHSRGQSVPSKEQIGFWQNRKRVDLFVLSKLPIESHILSVDDGWDAALDAMARSAVPMR